MTKIPIPDNVNECESILVELVRYSFELIFSLLTITDISEEEFLQKAVQTEGTIKKLNLLDTNVTLLIENYVFIKKDILVLSAV